MTNDFVNYSHVVLVTGARTWSDELSMRTAFARLWDRWNPLTVTRPLLVSGGCPVGADAMAERLWTGIGLEVRRVPADWQRYGRRAGIRRNREMVELVSAARDDGAQVACTTFIDLCGRPDCPNADQEQMRNSTGIGGHYSHGTMHTRTLASRAGIEILDVFAPRLPPF